MTYKYNPRTEEPSYTTALKQLRPRLADNNIEYHIDGKGNVLYWEDREEGPPTCEEVGKQISKKLTTGRLWKRCHLAKENIIIFHFQKCIIQQIILLDFFRI